MKNRIFYEVLKRLPFVLVLMITHGGCGKLKLKGGPAITEGQYSSNTGATSTPDPSLPSASPPPSYSFTSVSKNRITSGGAYILTSEVLGIVTIGTTLVPMALPPVSDVSKPAGMSSFETGNLYENR